MPMWAALLAVVATTDGSGLRQLAPEDFEDINEILGQVKVVLPTIETSPMGINIKLEELTCFDMHLEDITLTTTQVDSLTFDLRPTLTGLTIRCTAKWSYAYSALNIVGVGTVGISANAASLAAVLRVKPLDYELEGAVAPPSSPPASFHATSCQAASGCNFACGVTPAEYLSANLLTATSRQCYFCDTYYFSSAPDWCEYSSNSLFGPSLCCVLHDCIGVGCHGDGPAVTLPPPPPATSGPCTAHPDCTSSCGVTPVDFSSAGLYAASPSQCYKCETGVWDTTPGTCQFRATADWGGEDKCCRLLECSGGCPAPPPAPPAPCAAPSGCTHGCGVYPTEFSAARIPLVTYTCTCGCAWHVDAHVHVTSQPPASPW